MGLPEEEGVSLLVVHWKAETPAAGEPARTGSMG